MTVGVTTAVAMLILFPGFLGLKILEAITDYKHRTDFDKLGVAVGFSLVVYVAYFGIAIACGLPRVPAGYEEGAFRINGWSVLAVALLSSAVPLAVGITMNRGWLSRLNYHNWIADRDVGGPSSVWVGTFDDYCENKWVRAHLPDGTIIEGFVRWYSDNGEDHELFLSEAHFRVPDGEYEPVEGPGVLLGKDAPVSFVEFLDGEAKGVYS